MSENGAAPIADEVPEQQNAVSRVTSLPLVSSACSVVGAVYSSTKESHPYIRSVCDVAEKGAKTLTEAAMSGAQPLLTRLEPQIASANELVCKGLDKLESTLPILQQPTEKVVSDTKDLVTNTVTGARDTVTGAVSGVMGLAYGAMQGSVDMTRVAVSSVMGTRVGQLVTNSVDTVLGKSEELVDHYLPMTDEELAQLASSVEGFEVAPLQEQRKQQSYFVRLGSLSTRLRHRAYQHSLGKVRSARNNTQELLTQLHQTIDLLLEYRTFTMVQSLTAQLQTTCLSLVTGAQGLPSHIEERMQQLRQNAQDLHSSFSNIFSFGDLSAGILTQSREQVTKVRDHVDELFSYVVTNAPLTWLVGPFAPQLVESAEEQPIAHE
ncbi:perilipin-3 isoform X3 [Xenopus tropicalis]|uniref:Perilipin n=1 Tax=Xenopus tropicalis TaxID=8364 RepID=A0A8J0SCH8_XENTR|nr:perilipin-3 isoform X3 [Xenopus tropicalis]|eukprot:XP_012810363.1 PREDICTED: perilipin-3 isoform X3 [Xenopus tropicalis]